MNNHLAISARKVAQNPVSMLPRLVQMLWVLIFVNLIIVFRIKLANLHVKF